jgi:hypothetical protein
VLWEEVPGSRDPIRDLERENYELDGALDCLFGRMYTYISVVLWWGSLQPALESGDLEQAQQCFHAIERLLGSGDSNVEDAISIRVVSYLATPTYLDLARRHGGVLLSGLIEHCL